MTAFFGANSSGKTSILQVLLMFKQTVEHPTLKWDEPLYFGNETSLVNLGSFDDVIHQHYPNSNLGVSVSWRLSEAMGINEYLTDSLCFTTSIQSESGHPVLEGYCLFSQWTEMAVRKRRAELHFQVSRLSSQNWRSSLCRGFDMGVSKSILWS